MTDSSPAWPLLTAWTISDVRDFSGHFPGHVVLPGAFVLDGVIHQIEHLYGRRVQSVVRAKFAEVLQPGAVLHIHVQLGNGQVRFAALHGPNTALTGVLTLAVE